MVGCEGEAPATDPSASLRAGWGRYKRKSKPRGRSKLRPYKCSQAPTRRGQRRGVYFGEKISGLASLAAEVAETTLRVASTSLVTGGRQISVLQAW